MIAQPLSRTFRSLKPNSNLAPITKATTKLLSINQPQDLPQLSSNNKSSSSSDSASIPTSSSQKQWTVYLIISTNPPIKTYVGVTNNFSRRLKQHNGELKGGAKASCAGRPWICACLVRRFENKGKACQFESKWKILSRKLSRKRSRKSKDEEEQADDDVQLLLLQHRHTALNRVMDLVDCNNLEIGWHLSPL